MLLSLPVLWAPPLSNLKLKGREQSGLQSIEVKLPVCKADRQTLEIVLGILHLPL